MKGAWGRVFRATDTKLKRQVAIKILPPAFAADPDRLARFQREAEVLASLNHPNIAAIYGLEDAPSAGPGQAAIKALVMELVEGPTLADLIGGAGAGPRALPTEDALPIARQIAEALEAAHDHGVVHRDLKPANIKVRADGVVKVLDFGLAKLARAPDSGLQASGLSQAPTMTTPVHQAMMTGTGVILGTAAYMSPEQARGKTVDRRADIWAFGCVLFEMLTGRPVFGTSESVSDAIAAVLMKEPAWEALPADLPQPVRTLLQRCLEKDVARRLPHIGVARLDLQQPQPSAPEGAPSSTPRRKRWLLPATAGAALLAGALLAVAVFRLASPAAVAPTLDPPTRFTIFTADQSLSLEDTRSVAISSDGTTIAYTVGSSTSTELFVRRLDRLEAVRVGRPGRKSFPFLSPDGRWVGWADGSTLWKINEAGGAQSTVWDGAGVTLVRSLGASWGEDDVIVIASGEAGEGLVGVPKDGGAKTILTKPDTEAGEILHAFPSVLPGARTVLFAIQRVDRRDLAALDRSTGRYKVLVKGADSGEYVSSGHLIYLSGSDLLAVPFDLRSLSIAGDPAVVAENIRRKSRGVADFAVSRNGTIAHVQASTDGGPEGLPELVWLDRDGREEATGLPARRYGVVRLSPDGTRAVMDIREDVSQLWTWDLARGTLTQLASGASQDDNPLWTPDGRSIIFRSARTGTYDVFRMAADGTGTADRLADGLLSPIPKAVSPDGALLVVLEAEATPATGTDLNLIRNGQRQSQPLINVRGNQNSPDIAPNGRWIVYDSNESGTSEVFVRPFPNLSDGRWQVSTAGGSRPVWTRNGRELFFVDAEGYLMVSSVNTGAQTFSASTPARVSPVARLTGGQGARRYDVSPDGRRILMVKERTSARSTEQANTIVVVERATSGLGSTRPKP